MQERKAGGTEGRSPARAVRAHCKLSSSEERENAGKTFKHEVIQAETDTCEADDLFGKWSSVGRFGGRGVFLGAGMSHISTTKQNTRWCDIRAPRPSPEIPIKRGFLTAVCYRCLNQNEKIYKKGGMSGVARVSE